MRGLYYKLRKILDLQIEYYKDFERFISYSSTFSKNTEKKLESHIIYNYHGIEKGLSTPNLRFKFGKEKIQLLISLIQEFIHCGYNTNLSQFKVACTVLCVYYEIHKENNITIEDYFPKGIFSEIERYKIDNYSGILTSTFDTYFKSSKSNFSEFIQSRHSVRNFSDKNVSSDLIKKIIDLSKTAPSVCNRQANRVTLVNDYQIVQKLLNIQSGITATSKSIKQLLVVSFDRSYFFWISERNQGFIDSGIFIQNLLCSLHFHEVAACPLHWALDYHK